MAKCIKCNVVILDDTNICPLCHQILEPIPGEKVDNVYPNIKEKHKKMNFVIRLYVFLACVCDALFVLINLQANGTVRWSVITSAAFIYGFLTLALSTDSHFSLKAKMVYQTLWGVAFIIVIDYIFGFKGWSLAYILPSAIVVLDVIMLVLMLINRRYYQEYMVMEILLIALSVIPLLFYIVNLTHILPLALFALIASGILFIGTLIIGGPRSNAELSRRFHVN
ncbi:DUF6320 domain-containing protein [Eubacterium oxidoreducens]|uniref:Zinc ribbon domain-containing protein n=1 Tax=Eubacterium oxidoreducens TaxID=1732 RepID=A0A1G6BM57_EUBOX|nr:DUF6320 domain-containing protein [Eubacterium oxidoreducens]SDB21692.1 hypothetical protein SAMN02910417_01627 [Eubacterium oxidoreducens]